MSIRNKIGNKIRHYVKFRVSSGRPFNYRYFDCKYYRAEFLQNKCSDKVIYNKFDVPEVIYCFWTGDNDLTPNRINGLNVLEKKSGLPVQLVTKNNLHLFIKNDAPLHPAYEYLSCVHRADYLRCYFMYYYGGGYSDIKPCSKSWNNAYISLKLNKNKFAIGYHEEGPDKSFVAYLDQYYPRITRKIINTEMFFNYDKLLGNGCYIFRPYSNFGLRWLNELHRRLDINLERLKSNPGNIWGNNYGYPISWNSILGQIFHPLCLIYNEGLLYCNDLKPIFHNYR